MKSLLQVAALCGLILAPFGAQATENLTFGAFIPTRHAALADSVVPWIEMLKEQTGGELNVTLMADGSIVGPRDTLQGLRDGLVEMAYFVASYTPNEMPATSILAELSLLNGDVAVTTAAMNEMVLLNCPQCGAEAEDNNVKALGIGATTGFHLVCNKPFPTLESLKGARSRGLGAWGIYFSSIGATPVNMTTAEMYEALQRGQIDCVVIDLPGIANYSLQEVSKYIVDLPLGTFNLVHHFSANQDVWNRLSDRDKTVMIHNLGPATAIMIGKAYERLGAARELAAKSGITVDQPDPALVASLAAFQKTERDRVIALAKTRGVEGADVLIDKYAKLLVKWEKIKTETDGDWVKYGAIMQSEIFDKLKS